MSPNPSPFEVAKAHQHADDAFICADKAEKASLNGQAGIAAKWATQAELHFRVARSMRVRDAARKAGRRASAACEAVMVAFQHNGNEEQADFWAKHAAEVAKLAEECK